MNNAAGASAAHFNQNAWLVTLDWTCSTRPPDTCVCSLPCCAVPGHRIATAIFIPPLMRPPSTSLEGSVAFYPHLCSPKRPSRHVPPGPPMTTPSQRRRRRVQARCKSCPVVPCCATIDARVLRFTGPPARRTLSKTSSGAPDPANTALRYHH